MQGQLLDFTLTCDIIFLCPHGCLYKLFPFSNERLNPAVSNNQVDTYNIVVEYRVAI